MRALVVESFQTAKGIIPAGKIIEIADSLLNKLHGKVEPVADDYHLKTVPPFRGAVEIVTAEGERVWIATEPAAVKLIPEGAVYFLGDEIKQLQNAGKEAARAALMVKQVFPGATVIENNEAMGKFGF